MGLGSLLGATPKLTNKLARVFIQPLKADGSPDGDLGEKGLPFWPETISDSKGANWEEKMIPGGSHPLYQFVAGTARQLSFTIVLSHETQDVDPMLETDDPYNVNILGALAWLRAMVYPLYANDVSEPPPLVLITFPELGIGGGHGLDALLCVMTQCDIEYQACFNDGMPRLVTVSVQFFEVVQQAGEIFFHGRDLLYGEASKYKMNPKPRF